MTSRPVLALTVSLLALVLGAGTVAAAPNPEQQLVARYARTCDWWSRSASVDPVSRTGPST